MVGDLYNQPLLIGAGELENTLSLIQSLTPEALEARHAKRLENTWTVKKRGSVAVMPIHGAISRYDSFMNWVMGGTSMEDIAKDFTAALENPEIKAMVLDFDTPGGDAREAFEMGEMIRNSTKPVIAFVGGSCASLGLWLAASCDKIIVSKTAELGSLGVVFAYRKSGDNKTVEIVSAVSPKKRLLPDSDEGKIEYQTRADDLAQIFVAQMAKYRGVTEEKVKSDFGQGGMMIASKAIEAGMADKFGSLEEVIKDLQAQTSNSFGGIMGLTTDLRGLVAGKPDDEIEAAMKAVGFSPVKAGGDVDAEAVRVEGFETGKAEGLAEGKAAGSSEHKAYAAEIMGMCKLAGFEHMASSMIDKATTKEDAQKELLAEQKVNNGANISSNHDGGEKNPVASAFDAIAEKGA